MSAYTLLRRLEYLSTEKVIFCLDLTSQLSLAEAAAAAAAAAATAAAGPAEVCVDLVTVKSTH